MKFVVRIYLGKAMGWGVRVTKKHDTASHAKLVTSALGLSLLFLLIFNFYFHLFTLFFPIKCHVSCLLGLQPCEVQGFQVPILGFLLLYFFLVPIYQVYINFHTYKSIFILSIFHLLKQIFQFKFLISFQIFLVCQCFFSHNHLPIHFASYDIIYIDDLILIIIQHLKLCVAKNNLTNMLLIELTQIL